MPHFILDHHFFYEKQSRFAGAFKGPSPSTLKKQIALLKAVALPHTGIAQDSEPTFSITIDDGSRSVLDAADILIREKIPTVLCICGGPTIGQQVLFPHKVNLLRTEVGDSELLQKLKIWLGADSLDGLPLPGRYKKEDLYRYDDPITRTFKIAINYQLSSQQSSDFINQLFFEHFGPETSLAKELYLNVNEIKDLSSHFGIAYHGTKHLNWAEISNDDLKREICPPAELNEVLPANYKLSVPFGMKGSFDLEQMKTASQSFSGVYTMFRRVDHTIESNGFSIHHRFDQADFFKGEDWKRALSSF